jgi:hypothetical protein
MQASKTRLKQELVQGSNDGAKSQSSQGGSCSTTKDSHKKTSADVALAVLNYVWEMSLRLMHPYIPFVTEVRYFGDCCT